MQCSASKFFGDKSGGRSLVDSCSMEVKATVSSSLIEGNTDKGVGGKTLHSRNIEKSRSQLHSSLACSFYEIYKICAVENV